MMCIGKLSATRNSVIFHYWRFDISEIIFQFVLTFAYSYLVALVNLHPYSFLAQFRSQKKYFSYVTINVLTSFLFIIAGGILHYRMFANNQLIRRVFWAGHFTRFTLSTIFAVILIKIILLLRESRRKDNAHQLLRAAYLEAEVELLKEQLNPHFLFNALSSLSGIIREDATRAQEYVKHLSKIFRYTLIKPGMQLVSVENELRLLQSYARLLSLRYENAFKLHIDIDTAFLNYRLPHLSLQPLLENASKHNIVTLKHPLQVVIYIEDDCLVVANNLNPMLNDGNSTGIGLANLQQRYRLALQKDINISKTADRFIVKLPLTK
jgi:two-component system LytT family sensor kinase